MLWVLLPSVIYQVLLEVVAVSNGHIDQVDIFSVQCFVWL